MERKNRPAAIPTSQTLAQPQIKLKDNVVTATLPNSPDSVTVQLYGATVTSWTVSPSGKEQLFLSTAAKLDGSRPIRGGIPLVFPVFGAPPPTHATKDLSQHGFARNNHWGFLGSTSSESAGSRADDSVKLDFGLSSGMLDESTKKKWPFDFGLVYSVTLGKGSLEVGMHVQNKGERAFEFQCLFHTYLAVQDINTTSLAGLQSSPYVDKVRDAQRFTESSTASGIRLTSETDRVYTPPTTQDGKLVPLTLLEGGRPKMVISRDGLPDVTVWNQWEDKAQAMADFAPKDAWRRYICVEPGSVGSWLKLEGGDAWEGSCIMEARL